MDAAMDDRPRRRGADLTGVERPRRTDAGHGRTEVGIVENDAGALAAELEELALHPVACSFTDLLAHRCRAGERHHVDVGLDERLAGLGAGAGDDVEHAVGQPGLGRDLGEPQHRERVLRRRLDDDGVAHRERGRELPGHVDEREVRRDARDDTDRLARGDRADKPAGGERGRGRDLRRQRNVVRLDRLAGIATEPLHADRHLHGRRDLLGRTGLGLDERDELVVVLVEQLDNPQHHFGPLLGPGA